MSLSDKLKKELNITSTQNGDKAFKSTLNANLDLFGSGGSARELDENSIKSLISNAIKEDTILAIKNILYLSDVREGQGERRFFHIALDYLYEDYPDILCKLIKYIPEYGRWDYLYKIIEKDQFSKPAKKALQVIANEFHKHKDDYNSIMFKWLKTSVDSNKVSRKLGAITRDYLKLTQEEYINIVKNARSHLNVVEKKMSNNKFNEIKYEQVPSKASIIYSKAFLRNDSERYKKYLEEVKNGTKKINASVLTPVDILQKYKFNGRTTISEVNETLEVAWNNLPNYLEGTDENILPMIDVSSSMWTGYYNINPIIASVAIGIYFSQRCKSEFKDKFITFSEHPSLVELSGTTLKSIINNTNRSDWGWNTNILSAFKLILNVAKKYNLKQEELPTKFLILSDMQFDESGYENKNSIKVAKELYKESGYRLPELIFWNLNAEYGNYPVKEDKSGACLISGFNPVILKYIVSGKLETPTETMLKVLNRERYSIIDTLIK